jgi:hypothetical protein
MLFLVSNIKIEVTYCVNIKGMTSVLSNFTCCVFVFVTFDYIATNNPCQLTEHVGICLLFYQVLNIILKHFLHFQSISISRMTYLNI